ncbi:hypothetical protein F8B43_2471 [Methylorubrum populi]|uniref:Uncharacterized protein n=1 Tax=Methylorubrum populi TaxID=223967 RepID=A0A833MZZ6_9HYPH|nr:hypothetical protein F8B43_2471 [Methylorubrum populi]
MQDRVFRPSKGTKRPRNASGIGSIPALRLGRRLRSDGRMI